MELLTVSSTERDGWTILALVGQLDVATAPDFRQALQEAQYTGANRIVLDLASLEFLDSFGLGVILGGVKRATSHDGRLVIAGAPPRVHQVFELAGIEAALPLADDVDQAIAS